MKKLFIFLDIDGVLNNWKTNQLVNDHFTNGTDISKQVKFTNWLSHERGDFVDVQLLKNLPGHAVKPRPSGRGHKAQTATQS